MWDTHCKCWSLLGQVALDEKCRIVLDKKTRAVAGLKRGDRLTAIPFKGGVILVAPSKRRFEGSLTGFRYTEERHEASRFIFRRRN